MDLAAATGSGVKASVTAHSVAVPGKTAERPSDVEVAKRTGCPATIQEDRPERQSV